ncbi:hypothetical protein BH11PAT2_BH11PAT2_07200 [soil metagenome]
MYLLRITLVQNQESGPFSISALCSLFYSFTHSIRCAGHVIIHSDLKAYLFGIYLTDRYFSQSASPDSLKHFTDSPGECHSPVYNSYLNRNTL